MKRCISRNEAAEILGVCPQTIANYAARGIIRKIKSRTPKKTDYFSMQDVEKLAADFLDEPEIKADIEELQKEYRNEVKELKLKIKSIRALIDAATIDNLIYFGQAASGVVELVFNIYGDKFSDRDKYVIEQALAFRGVQGSADELGLIAERVRQVLHRAIRKMAKLSRDYEVKVRDVQKENELLLETNRLLTRENNAFREAGIKVLTEAEMEKIEERKRLNGEYVTKHWEILNTKIRDLEFSQRVRNCLRVADIETVADLVYLSRNDLEHYRNFGKKSLREIDHFIEHFGLEYNAPVGELVQEEKRR